MSRSYSTQGTHGRRFLRGRRCNSVFHVLRYSRRNCSFSEAWSGRLSRRISREVSFSATHALLGFGANVSEEKAHEYQERIPKTSLPDGFALRVILLGFRSVPKKHTEEWESIISNHVLWIVNHHPESYVAGAHCHIDPLESNYEVVRDAWLRHMQEHPDDLTILANAISFFEASDRSYSISLCNKGKQLAPNDAEWPKRLGFIHELNGDWHQALQEYEKAIERTEHRCRHELLPRIAKMTLAAQELEKARTMVEELAQVDYPEIRHDTLLLLGRCACLSGDIESAKSNLIKAADFPCAPGSGPSLALAKELLERGERAVVVEYLRLCSRHWTLGVERLRYWGRLSEIERGGVPEFGANLYY